MTAPTTKNIALITGSTRAVRIGPQVTRFVKEILDEQLSLSKDTTFALAEVDIASFKLPVFDEEVIPATVPFMAQFAHEHSKAWSAEIAKYDGYVLVTACYNAGPPGGVKNAIDYLYNEIKGKPFLIISYGIMGGDNASDSLKITLESMYAHVAETRPMLSFAKNEPITAGMPWDMIQASQGKLGEDTAKDWAQKKEEIVKGFGELKEFLVRPLQV
ncbi:NADPH-dependent FMN reductase [Rhexocercosporidium sp. MPI-PUGE-AT-0058]|nr:NADPH-dependent FMN reductase [Rhexocercosporidium sp. MPI-PUGE-AT-0058]